jgi:hypothetical protein
MTVSLHFNLNRPIHMARRDAHFERAMDLLAIPTQDLSTAARMSNVEKILALLKVARHHAFFVSRSPDASQVSQDFLHFLEMNIRSLESVLSMMQHQLYLEGEESFLCQFLHATTEECALPALHYRRRADDILEGIWHLLGLAHRRYRDLQKSSIGILDDDEQERYHRAYRFFSEEARSHYNLPPAPDGDATWGGGSL